MGKQETKRIYVFTDGASRGNPGPGGWGAIIVYPDGTVMEFGGADPQTTNNRMELTAVVTALEEIARVGGTDDVVIYTDSKYVFNGARSWAYGWERNNWRTTGKTPVLNRDLWERYLAARRALAPREVSFEHVPGHSGLAGNERADRIATAYANGKACALYCGPASGYHVDISNMSIDREREVSRAHVRRRSSQKAYAYVSAIDGDVRTHRTWEECEARVKGARGARYRKVFSRDEMEELIRRWQAG